jgi:hypothetical protein
LRTSLSDIVEASRPEKIRQVKKVQVLDEARVFLESCHFGKSNIRRYKQGSGCVKLECPSRVDISGSFQGLVGYYRKFIEGFSKIIKLMTELLGKDKKFK